MSPGLPYTLESKSVLCDDMLIAKDITMPSDSGSLEEDLDSIAEWTQLWGMSFNNDRTVTNKSGRILTGYILNKVVPVSYTHLTLPTKA